MFLVQMRFLFFFFLLYVVAMWSQLEPEMWLWLTASFKQETVSEEKLITFTLLCDN